MSNQYFENYFKPFSSADNHLGTDKNTIHSYVPVYAKYMNNTEDVNLLEIGIFSGMSLNAWNDCFRKSLLVGVDIDLSNLKIIPDANMKIIKADATKIDILNILPRGISYDYIIDDGSHNIQDILITFKLLNHFLKDNGIYFIEDIQNFDKDIPLIKSLAEGLGFECIVEDLRKNKNRYDDILVVIRNK